MALCACGRENCVVSSCMNVQASQIGYEVSPLQEAIIEHAKIACLDMEAAPVGQILNQVRVTSLVILEGRKGNPL